MATSPIVVVGGSAGALPALETMLAELPDETPAALFVVVHIGSESTSHLPEILGRSTRLDVRHAVDDAPYQAGRVYVAPPDHHLLVADGRMRLARGPKENRFRPAVDALFRSAAATAGPRVTAVVLSGVLDDGTAGAWSVKDRGGAVIVQDLAEAQFGSMPESVIRHVGADHCLPAQAIGRLLARLPPTNAAPPREVRPVSRALEIETMIAAEGRALQLGVMDLGKPTAFTCPECHGVLVQLPDGGIPRFRCHTGHAFSLRTLLADVTGYIETSLWNALRAIEEAMILLDQKGAHDAKVLGDDPELRSRLAHRGEQARRQAQLLRDALAIHEQPGDPAI